MGTYLKNVTLVIQSGNSTGPILSPDGMNIMIPIYTGSGLAKYVTLRITEIIIYSCQLGWN